MLIHAIFLGLNFDMRQFHFRTIKSIDKYIFIVPLHYYKYVYDNFVQNKLSFIKASKQLLARRAKILYLKDLL